MIEKTWQEKWIDYRRQTDAWYGRGDQPLVSGPVSRPSVGHEVSISDSGLTGDCDKVGLAVGLVGPDTPLFDVRCSVCGYLTWLPRVKAEVHAERHVAAWAGGA